MAVNQVVINGVTVVDLTDATAEADDVMEGKTFYSSDGAKGTGTFSYTGAFYGTCASSASTANKVVTITNTSFKLAEGVMIGVRFSATNTADNVTLNVNSTGAKQIYYGQSPYTGHTEQITGYANRVIYYMYNGTYWVYAGSSTANAITLEGVLAVEHGGTAATTASAARTNLGLGDASTCSVETALADDNKLPTGSAVKTYVDSRTVLTKTVSGTTSSTGAISHGLDVSNYKILGARSTNANNRFAFVRGDGYLTVFQVSNNAMTVLASTAVTFEVYYCAV